MRKDIVRDTPSLEDFCDYIERKGYDIDPFALYKEFEDFDYLTVELTDVQYWTIIILLLIFNIGMSFWIVTNNYKNDL